jgi:hypothetical protein
MKTKRLIITLAVIGMAIFLGADAFAGRSWYTCTVDKIGPAGTGDTVLLQLTDSGSAFSEKWFTAKGGREKEYLAVGLTAIANNLTILVYTDISESGYPYIRTLYLNQ